MNAFIVKGQLPPYMFLFLFFSTVNTYKILTVSQDSKYFLQTIKEGCLRKVLIEKMDTRSTVHLMRCKKSSHLFQQSHYFDSKD